MRCATLIAAAKSWRSSRWAVVVALLLVTTFWESPVGAEEGTLDRLVGEVQRKLQTALARHRQAASEDLLVVVKSGPGLTGAEALPKALRRLLLSRIRAAKTVASVKLLASTLSGAALERWARGQGAELLLALRASVEGGHLQLRGELKAVGASLWRDLLQGRRGSLSFLHGKVRVDGEVRGFFRARAAARKRFSSKRFSLGKRPVLALAAVDLDRDGRLEVLALHPRHLRVLAPPTGASGRYLPRAELPLMGKRAVVAPRRPVGSLLVADLDRDRRPEVFLRTSALSRGQQVRFDGDKKLKMLRELGTSYPLVTLSAGNGQGRRRVDGVAVTGVDLFRAADLSIAGAASQPVKAGAIPPKSAAAPKSAGLALAPALPPRFYRLKMVRVATTSGPRYIGAALDPQGRLHLVDGALRKPLALIAGVGLAFDLADLDDDGRAELIVTNPAEQGFDDRIAIYRLQLGKPPQLLWRSPPLAARVSAMTHGDLDGDGKLEIVAALRDGRGRCTLLHID